MGRRATIWFSATRGGGGYFTGYKGKRRRLHPCDVDDAPDGPNYRAAMKAFDALIDHLNEPDPKDQTIGIALERWCRHCDEGNAMTGKVNRSLFAVLRERMGHIDVSRVTGDMLLGFVKEHGGWNSNTKSGVLKRLKTCFTWNVEKGFCTYNPLDGLKVAKHYSEEPRGEEYVLPPPLKQLLLTTGSKSWRELLLALSLTGARPGELFAAERKHYRAADQQIILKEHKTAKKLKRADKRRVITMADEVDAIVRDNLRRSDLCFPTMKGHRWKHHNAYMNLERTLATEPVAEWLRDNGHDASRVILYSFRHTFATDAILRNVSAALIANMLGTSVKMIEDTYSHALASAGGMKDAYLKAIGRKPAPPASE